MTYSVKSASVVLIKRYLNLCNEIYNPKDDFCYIDDQMSPPKCTYKNIIWMCETLLQNIDEYPEDKVSRWLGFIQGCLSMREVISVDEERDFSRPLFHAAYAQQGIDIPETFELIIK